MSYTYTDYHRDQEEVLWRAIVMNEVKISPQSAPLLRENVPHGGSENRESPCIRYQTYLVPESRDLSDAIAFANGDSVHVAPSVRHVREESRR